MQASYQNSPEILISPVHIKLPRSWYVGAITQTQAMLNCRFFRYLESCMVFQMFAFPQQISSCSSSYGWNSVSNWHSHKCVNGQIYRPAKRASIPIIGEPKKPSPIKKIEWKVADDGKGWGQWLSDGINSLVIHPHPAIPIKYNRAETFSDSHVSTYSWVHSLTWSAFEMHLAHSVMLLNLWGHAV